VVRLRKKYSAGSLVMYLATFVLEIPVIVLRLLLALILVEIVFAILGYPTASSESWADLVLLLSVWSLLALVWPGGSGWWWRQRIGGREPSQREQLAYQDAIELLQDQAHEPLPAPGTWFVLDTPEPDAAVVGNALMLSRGLLESPHLPAVLARAWAPRLTRRQDHRRVEPSGDPSGDLRPGPRGALPPRTPPVADR
jgi:hypothetical protein